MENPTGPVRNPKDNSEIGEIELYDLGDVSKKTQRPSCSKSWPEGLLYCTCGVCLRPAPEQKRKIKSEFDVLSIPYYTVENGLLTRSKTWAEPMAI